MVVGRTVAHSVFQFTVFGFFARVGLLLNALSTEDYKAGVVRLLLSWQRMCYQQQMKSRLLKPHRS